MYEELIYDFLKSLSMIVLFLIFMFGVASILKYKASIIVDLLKIGSKKEATTYYGGISFGTIIIIGIIAVAIIYINEVAVIFSSIFDFELRDMGSPVLLSIFSILFMALFNFIFLGFIFWMDKKH